MDTKSELLQAKSTTEIGDKLEDQFYLYLLDQQEHGELVYGAYSPGLCKIYKKKKYYCGVRKNHITFDVVIEVFRQGGSDPHLIVVFECKNHGRSVEEDYINAFSEKLGRISKHGSKGIIVASSSLQSGAKNVAEHHKMGIVKYCEHGFEIIADRKGGLFAESRFVETQIFKTKTPVKSLKFSAYQSNRFFGSIRQLLESLDPSSADENKNSGKNSSLSAPYIPDDEIKKLAQEILAKIDYKKGKVELEEVCSKISVDLKFTHRSIHDQDGEAILGSANFDRKLISINDHENKQRERFTIAHEIGHFCLNHGQFLRSETILERDLLLHNEKANSFNYERLEFQANSFASHLLLPEDDFLKKTKELRNCLDIRDRGYGYIYVDDQPSSYSDYFSLLSGLSTYFEVSKQAIEIKFKKLKLLNDQRRRPETLSLKTLSSGSITLEKN